MVVLRNPASDTKFLIELPAKSMLSRVIKVYKDDKKAAQFQDNSHIVLLKMNIWTASFQR